MGIKLRNISGEDEPAIVTKLSAVTEVYFVMYISSPASYTHSKGHAHRHAEVTAIISNITLDNVTQQCPDPPMHLFYKVQTQLMEW